MRVTRCGVLLPARALPLSRQWSLLRNARPEVLHNDAWPEALMPARGRKRMRKGNRGEGGIFEPEPQIMGKIKRLLCDAE